MVTPTTKPKSKEKKKGKPLAALFVTVRSFKGISSSPMNMTHCATVQNGCEQNEVARERKKKEKKGKKKDDNTRQLSLAAKKQQTTHLTLNCT